MFFRREKPQHVSFAQSMDELKKQGFSVQPESGGGMRAGKGGCAAVIREGKTQPIVGQPGVAIGSEIGSLVDGGYQKFWLTPSGVRVPAEADHLRALHAFEEDLREGLGLISLYNESLGTTNAKHLYDRVKDRDHGVPHRPWE